MTKALLTLSGLQMAALFFVGARLATLEAKVDGQTLAAKSLAVAAPAAPQAPCPRLVDSRAVQAETPAKAVASAPRMAPAAPAPTVSAPSTAVSNIAMVDVRSDLARYLAQGRMSAADMDDFHAKLAELSQEDRRVMLRELTGAMNAGRLDARL